MISVGNLAMGGRGKTPVTAFVASLLVEAGEKPAIISRGYGRRKPEDGAVIVSDGERQLADVARGGDEPVMMARRVRGAAVVVCDVRAVAAALAESALGVTVHVLDDGFQHRSMRRDVDLVIVTPGDLDDRPLPFGRLRSSVRSLRAASAVIVDDAPAAELEARLSALVDRERTPVFTLVRRSGALQWIERPATPSASIAPPPGARVVALSGIARPERFANALRQCGCAVVDTSAFADHHAFTPRDLARVRARVAETSAAFVVTTEKDAMRLLPLRPLGFPLAVLPLEVSIEPAAEFRRWLMRRVGEVRQWRG